MKEDMAIQNLREIKEIFDKNDIQVWLDCGTLLGAIREGRIIAWDKDTDLGTWYDNLRQIISLFPEFKKRRFKVSVNTYIDNIGIERFGCQTDVELWHKRGDYAWQVWVVRDKKIGKLLRWFVYSSSLMTYTKPKGTVIRKSECLSFLLPLPLKILFADLIWPILDRCNCTIPVVVPKHHFEKLSTVRYYGLKFPVPSDVEKYLEFRYGSDWKTPIKKWICYKDDGSINPSWRVLLRNMRKSKKR